MVHHDGLTVNLTLNKIPPETKSSKHYLPTVRSANTYSDRVVDSKDHFVPQPHWRKPEAGESSFLCTPVARNKLVMDDEVGIV